MRLLNQVKAFKPLIYGVGALLLLTVTGLTIGYLTPRRWNLPAQSDCNYKVYVASDGFHVNVIVPVTSPVFDWRQQLFLQDIGVYPQANYQYLSFGWGERFFYIATPSWDQVNPLAALRALFLLNPTAMHVQGYEAPPKTGGGTEVRTVYMSQESYLRLNQFIEKSFQADAQGKKIRVLARGHSSFYEANGRYSILKTCNTWAAESLDKANIQTPLWSGLAPAVMLHLKSSCDPVQLKP